jgi:hypothetical protein
VKLDEPGSEEACLDGDKKEESNEEESQSFPSLKTKLARIEGERAKRRQASFHTNVFCFIIFIIFIIMSFAA